MSAASTAGLRTTVTRTLMETAPKPRASNATRREATVALPGRRLVGIPGEELVQTQIVDALCNWGGDGIEDQGLQPAPIRAFVCYS